MRLIDADKLLENSFKNPISYNAFCNLVKRQMTVDAVPVVRCKDCKRNPLETWVDCPLAHLKYDGERWCWKGERKDGDHAEGTIQKERS